MQGDEGGVMPDLMDTNEGMPVQELDLNLVALYLAYLVVKYDPINDELDHDEAVSAVMCEAREAVEMGWTPND